MAGFIRRFTSFPSLDVIAEIEAVDIVDLIPTGIFAGRQLGTVCLVGEWPAGPVNTPTVVEGDQTIRDVFGGFSLAMTNPLSYGSNPYSNGCAFVWLKNKTFRRLVLVRADMSLTEGATISLDDATLVAATGQIDCDSGGAAVLPADGEEFILDDGINDPVTFRFYLTTPVVETDTLREVDISAAADDDDVRDAILAAVAGAPALRITAANGGAGLVDLTNDVEGAHGNVTITDTVAAAGFVVTGMAGGDGIGVLEAALIVPAGTRIYDASAPTVEFALGQPVTFAAGVTPGAAGTAEAFDETLGLDHQYTDRTVYGVPVFSTQGVSEGVVGDVDTVNSGDLFRAGIGAGTALPTLDVLTSTAILDGAPANVSALTVLTSGQIDTRYENAIDATLPGEDATDNIEILASARTSQAIRTKGIENARDASAVGTGRDFLVRPPIGTLPATARGSGANGVGATRTDRGFFCYPHFEQRIPEIAELDPTATISSANILIGADAAMATILSNLPPENNPGQSTASIRSGGLLTFIRKLEDGLAGAGLPTKFRLQNYIDFKASGIAALRRDPRISEWVFQSGVTSVDPALYPTLAPIKRRRMADYLQDSMAIVALKFNKLPGTDDRYGALIGELVDFLDTQQSKQNPPAQRITAYAIDSKSGNTTTLQGLGIRVVIVAVRLLDTLDAIVLQTSIGETVEVVSSN